jgi:hypothetical protein
VLQLLQTAAEQGSVLYWLCMLPGAAGISSESVLGLMQTAIARSSRCFHSLCGLQGAADLGMEQKFTLLMACVQNKSTQSQSIVKAALCNQHMRAGEQLSSEQLMQLLWAAVESGHAASNGCTFELISVPAAEQLVEQQVIKLLTEAVKLHDFTIMRALCKLPAARKLSEAAVAGLVEAVEQVQCNDNDRREECEDVLLVLRELLGAV